MSFDLYERETQDRLAAMPPVQNPEPGAFDGFMRGTGLATMKGLARVGRSIDMLGAVAPVAYDAFTGGTEAQTQYFKEHDDAWGSAVDYWTPKPGEVGVAAEVTGQLLSTLPVVIASPGLAVADLQIGTAEDLVKKGVSAGKAQAVGAVQGAGLGLGIWMPILGSNGWQRLVVGGAGFNVLQGVTTRAASGLILEGTPAAKDFEAFNGEALTLDVLLGLAFGGLAHINPAMRAQGKEAWTRLEAWAQKLQPSDVAAIAALRQAQHLNVDSAPGKPAAPADVEAHVARVRQAIEQISRGEPVQVSDLPGGAFEQDAARASGNDKRAAALVRESEALAKTYGIELETDGAPARRAEIEKFLDDQRVMKGEEAVRRAAEETISRADAEGVPGFLRSAEDLIALRSDKESKDLEPIVQQAIGIAKKPGFERSAEEKILLDSVLGGRLRDFLQPRSPKEEKTLGAAVSDALKTLKKTGAPAGQPRGAEPPPPRGPSGGKPAGAEATAPDPLALEADRVVQELPSRLLRVGSNPDGTPIHMTAKEYLEGARADAKKLREDIQLVEIAAQCLLGGGR